MRTADANRLVQDSALSRLLALGFAAAAVAVPRPALSQATPEDRALAEGLLSTAQAASRPRPRCGETDEKGEIVVCGANRGEQWRVPSTTDSDPDSPAAQKTGVPRAPNVSSLPDCRRGCIGMGRAPPPVYVVDFAKLPPAPAGSDADKIAKGLIPDR